jgi:hypothetical protein
MFAAIIAPPSASAAQPVDTLDAGDLMATSGTLSAEPVIMLPVSETDEEIAAAALDGEAVPFRTDLSAESYAAAKTSAAVEAGRSAPRAPETSAPPDQIGAAKSFAGVNATVAGGLRPPDTHGAMGDSHYTQIVNSHTRAYKKQDNSLQFQRSLATHFGYTTETIFDPRVLYDPVWDRWIWTAEARPESNTVQLQFIAISETKRPHGSYWVYKIDMNNGSSADFFWDYPQLGMTQDAIIITANVFDPDFTDAWMFAIAKAKLYNASAFSVPIFKGLPITVAPPIVMDENPSAFFVQAPRPASVINMWRGDNLENAGFASLTFVGAVPVSAYGIPPSAPQVGTTDTLDTLDARFVNASTQIGETLVNVHTVDDFGFATPRWYEFDTGTPTVIQGGNFFAGGSSFDFNASIAKNTSGDMFVTWSSTMPNNAEVRFGGREATDPANTMFVNPTALQTSPTFYDPSGDTTERWGDYSAVVIDPKPPEGCDRRAWITNEWIESTTVWGSWITRIGYC